MTNANTYEALQAARKDVEAAMEAVEAAETAYRAVNDRLINLEPTDADSKIQIVAKYPKVETPYTFLAYRPKAGTQGAEDWYLTGRQGSLSWADIFNRLKAAEVTIEKLTFT